MNSPPLTATAMELIIGTVNACGTRRKHPLLKNMLKTDNVHILSITETKLTRALTVPGYHCFQRNNPTGGKRGVALLVKDSFAATPYQLPQHLQDLECVAATVHFPSRQVVFFSYYNPPQSHSNISQDLLHFVSSLPNAVLLGDLNARHTQFGDSICNQNGIALVNTILTQPLWRIRNILPTFFNHSGSSIIDHILCSEQLYHFFGDDCFLGTSITSDHLPLLAKTSLSPPPPAPPAFIIKQDFSKTNWATFTASIQECLPIDPPLSSPAHIDDAVSDLTSIIQNAVNISVPKKRIIVGQRPLPSHIIDMIREKRRIFRQYLRTRDPNLKTEFNRQSARIRRETTRFTEEKWIRVTEGLDYRDGKKFWHKFNILTRRKKTKPHHLVDSCGTIVSTPQGKADLFKNHLQSTFQTPDHPHFDDRFKNTVEAAFLKFKNRTRPPLDLSDDDAFMAPVTPDQIKFHLKGKNSAPGEDGLNRLILRHLPETAFQLLATIFNSCLKNCHFPALWKSAITVMIPKPFADPTSVSSYRPISLLSCVGKTFEKILASRLRDYLEENNLLPGFQFGFRPNRSTKDPLLKLQTEATRAINTKKCALAVFLDIKQAFDRVWHAGLIRKMLHLNVPVHFARLICSYLSDRSARVKVAGATSLSFTPQAGVPQGSAIAPILYLIYASDSPPSAIQELTVSHFADDTAYWVSRRSSQACSQAIQAQLDEFSKWARKWRILPNPSKTQVILFRHANMTTRPTFAQTDVRLTFWGEELRLQDDISYLGVRFYKTLSLTPDINITIDKIRNRSNLLKALKVRLNGCSPETLLHTYKTFVRPVVDYRAPLYSTLPKRHMDRLKQTERKILRYIHRLHHRFPSDELFSRIDDPKLIPIDDRLTKLQQNFTTKRIRDGPPDTLTTFLLAPGPLTTKPKKKLKYPPARLLQLVDDLPEDYEEALLSTPYILR